MAVHMMNLTAANGAILRHSLPMPAIRAPEFAGFPSPSLSASSLSNHSLVSIRSIYCVATRRNPLTPCRSSESAGDVGQGLGLLLEVEGVLADIYRFGNRQAFNVGVIKAKDIIFFNRTGYLVPLRKVRVNSFKKLGLDCAYWTEPIYIDLTRKASGDEQRMLVLFFNRIGWPTSLPTNEKETFMKSVLREKRIALDEFVQSGNLPLRPGIEDFIDDALNENLPVIMLTAYSKNGDKISRFVIERLGLPRVSKMKVVGKDEVEGSLYGQLVLGKGVSSSLDDQLAKETHRAVSSEKQRIAKEVAFALKLSVDIDTRMSESIDQVVATLRAGAEYASLSVQECVLIAGSQSGVLGAERIGMPCVVIRSSLTSRAEFHSANAVMDGFGGADLTISQLRQKTWT